MQLFCWILAAYLAVGALLAVASVGKPKQPLTGGTAAVVVLIVAAEVVGLAFVATGVLR